MKLSEKWLRTFVDPKLNTEEVCEQLTIAGFEVESITSVKPKFQGVIIGQVLTTAKHPSADRLTVCEVDVGLAEPLQIVCGASNVRSGLKAPVALSDAVLANGNVIKKTMLRGVESNGMLCSASELGLDDDVKGLLELPDDAKVGAEFGEYLSLNDNIIEINITPNRGDCFSVLGIAREVSVLNDLILSMPSFSEVKNTLEKTFKVTVEAKDICPSYVGRILSGINLQAKTPLWMKNRLQSSGIRSVNPIVDVTNYVMLELGQPLHAFDLKKINGSIEVRLAKPQEKITLLDGRSIDLTDKDLIIADDKNPIALAGIMGGNTAEVDNNTVDVFLESAFFIASSVFASGRHHNIHTEASHRFERGVDPNLQQKALERATLLLQEIAGGLAGPVTEVVSKQNLPKRKSIVLRHARIGKILGFSIPYDAVGKILKSLNMEVKADRDQWTVVPPSYRFDIDIEADLIEEVARIYGYNKIPALALVLNISGDKTSYALKNRKLVRSFLRDNGYHEVVTYGFTDPKLQALFDPDRKFVSLVNPISPDLSVMRTTLWPGLIKTALYNQNRQQERIRFFEMGMRFRDEQSDALAGIVIGDLYPLEWDSQPKAADFFDLKNDVNNLLSLFASDREIDFRPEPHPALHPGISARIYLNSKPVGFLGKLHPKLKETLNLIKEVYLFELDLTFLDREKNLKFTDISKFPFVARDLALVIKEEIPWSKLKSKIIEISSPLLQSVELFDIYRGEGIPEGHKSVATRLIFQHLTHTLQEEEVEKIVSKILSSLEAEFQAQLRG